jgi:hypothetical protein
MLQSSSPVRPPLAMLAALVGERAPPAAFTAEQTQ